MHSPKTYALWVAMVRKNKAMINMTGRMNNKFSRPKLKPPTTCSPHVSRTRRVESFRAAMGPLRSITRIGTTR
jgi:hypothetical protein